MLDRTQPDPGLNNEDASASLDRDYVAGGKAAAHIYLRQNEWSRRLGNRKSPGLFDLQSVDKYVVGPGSTVTETVTAPGQTVTVTQENDVTQTVISCPPGAQVQGANAGSGVLGGSLAYTGGGDDPMMSLLGGALTAAGLTLLFMARKRLSPRRH